MLKVPVRDETVALLNKYNKDTFLKRSFPQSTPTSLI